MFLSFTMEISIMPKNEQKPILVGPITQFNNYQLKPTCVMFMTTHSPTLAKI